MHSLKLSFALLVLTLATLTFSRAQQVRTQSDPYRAWAIQQWGAAVVNDPAQEAAIWGESADPDGDHHTNLEEYAFGTDPKQPNVDPVSRDFGGSTPGYLTLSYTQRANDPALIVFPQYSSDVQAWWPLPPRDASRWTGDGTYF